MKRNEKVSIGTYMHPTYDRNKSISVGEVVCVVDCILGGEEKAMLWVVVLEWEWEEDGAWEVGAVEG